MNRTYSISRFNFIYLFKDNSSIIFLLAPCQQFKLTWRLLHLVLFLFSEFQKKVLTKLVDVHMEVRRLGRSDPPLSSAHIEQLELMEEFEREEECLNDKQAFESLV